MNLFSRVCVCSVVACVLMAGGSWAQLPYTQQEDVSYGDAYGIALPMDVFTPTGDKNGIGIVDIASGAWHSDRGKIRDHTMAQFYTIFCKKGYTVFAVRPGSVTKFSATEMLSNINTAIRFIKEHAEDYDIDPDNLGITGASAGGHLASLTVVSAQDGNAEAKGLMRHSTHVKAAGIFFPPTNFLDWDGEGLTNFARIGPLLFNGGIKGHDDDEIEAMARKISPALNIKGKTPPFIIWHGDADPLVPLQQSEFLVEQLKEVGTDVELHVKEGGGHPWLTIPEEVAKIADWFDEKLGND